MIYRKLKVGDILHHVSKYKRDPKELYAQAVVVEVIADHHAYHIRCLTTGNNLKAVSMDLIASVFEIAEEEDLPI